MSNIFPYTTENSYMDNYYGQVCSGGKCDKAPTCEHVLNTNVWHNGHRIMPVSAGQHCGYYRPVDALVVL